MNCRDNESLILAERDGALTQAQLAALSDHVAACPACRKLRLDLATALDTCQGVLASVTVPDSDEAWRDLQSRLRQPAKKHPLAPVIWFGTPLAAAAALAVAFFVVKPATPPPRAELAAIPPAPLHDPSIIAGADYVEAGNPDASVMIFVDKESGWLVVWATDSDTTNSG
jgi:anti-sigma factor RsiW